MTTIKYDKHNIIIELIIYVVLMIIICFIVKQDYIILLIGSLVMFSIHITLEVGNYITYDENELIKHSMFKFTKMIKFEDIKYIKTEHRFSNKDNTRYSVLLWIITLNDGKDIKIKIDSFSSSDLKQFKIELNTKHKNIIIKTPQTIDLNGRYKLK